MDRLQSTTTLTLNRNEALVLFEMLAEAADQNCVLLRTAAEKLAVARLQGALEGVLVEAFMPEYPVLIDEARAELMRQTDVDVKATAA